MKKQARKRHLVVTVLFIMTALMISHRAFAQPQSICTDEEVQVTDKEFVVLPNVIVKVPTPTGDENEKCILTFSAEVATSEDSPQLLELGYNFFFDPEELPPPFICTTLDGPTLTRIADGFDQTHTMISVFGNTPSAHEFVLTPCVKSVFGGQFRLRRHCLVIKCDQR